MVIIIGALLLSMIPALLFYFWFRKMKKEDLEYQKLCQKSLVNGLLATLPVAGCAFILQIVGSLTGILKGDPLIAEAYKDIVLAALVEEVAKFFMFSLVIKKTQYGYSWRDLIIFMTLVGLGFELLESLVYVIESNVVQILVRGLTMMHGGYGFIMGYFYGKARYTGKKINYIAAFLIPFLLHGIYDFTLSPEVNELSEYMAFIPVTLAFVGLVLVFVMIRFFRKKGKQEKYTTPIAGLQSSAAEE